MIVQNSKAPFFAGLCCFHLTSAVKIRVAPIPLEKTKNSCIDDQEKGLRKVRKPTRVRGFKNLSRGANVEENPNPYKDLEAQVSIIKNEVDALQISIMKQNAPWYKNVPTVISTVISVVALIFSFGTTYVSHNRTKAQDIQNRRSELRSMLQRLALLPKDNFELTKKYSDDPGAVGLLSGYINQENSILSRQAAEVAKKLPPDQISATEYYAIGLALQSSYNIEEALEFLQKAITESHDFNDEIAAVRSYANLLFMIGQPEAGRVEYEKALNIFSKHKGYNDWIQKSTHIWTELGWAIAEANNKFMDQANEHVAKAESYLLTLPPSPGTEQLRNQIMQTKSALNMPQK